MVLVGTGRQGALRSGIKEEGPRSGPGGQPRSRAPWCPVLAHAVAWKPTGPRGGVEADRPTRWREARQTVTAFQRNGLIRRVGPAAQRRSDAQVLVQGGGVGAQRLRAAFV